MFLAGFLAADYKQKTWSELIACSEWLLETHGIVFEVFPITITIVHSLCFTDTLEFNREPMFLDKKIYLGYERSKKLNLSDMQ